MSLQRYHSYFLLIQLQKSLRLQSMFTSITSFLVIATPKWHYFYYYYYSHFTGGKLRFKCKMNFPRGNGYVAVKLSLVIIKSIRNKIYSSSIYFGDPVIK